MHCTALHPHLSAALGAPALTKTSINRIAHESLSTGGRCALPRSPFTSTSRRHALMGMYNGGRSRRQCLCTAAKSQAKSLLEQAQQTFENGDRMRALRLYEDTLKQLLTPEERQEALYGTTVVHASFGDVEQAQMSLREGIESGLDFEAALSDSRFLKWKSAPQVLSQLRKFARTLKQIREAVQPSRKKGELAAPRLSGAFDSGEDRFPGPNPDMSLGELLRTDIKGMDATVTGIVKRVTLLLVVGLLLGTALFYIGLEFSGIAH